MYNIYEYYIAVNKNVLKYCITNIKLIKLNNK